VPQPLVDTGGRQRDVLGAGLVQAAEVRRAMIRGVRPLKSLPAGHSPSILSTDSGAAAAGRYWWSSAGCARRWSGPGSREQRDRLVSMDCSEV
jgi:hypothetical protein